MKPVLSTPITAHPFVFLIQLSPINRNLLNFLDTEYQGIRDNYPSDFKLSDLCYIIKDRGSSEVLTTDNYYSTENMLPEKAGVTSATALPSDGKATLCEKGDTLVSNIRPYFKKIHYCTDKSGCSADVICFRAKNKDHSPYIYSILHTDDYFDYVVAGSKGTKMPRGDKDQMMEYSVPIPPDNVLSKFNSFGNFIMSSVSNNNETNRKLIDLRDYILPKLMSGEIDVSKLEITN